MVRSFLSSVAFCGLLVTATSFAADPFKEGDKALGNQVKAKARPVLIRINPTTGKIDRFDASSVDLKKLQAFGKLDKAGKEKFLAETVPSIEKDANVVKPAEGQQEVFNTDSDEPTPAYGYRYYGGAYYVDYYWYDVYGRLWVTRTWYQPVFYYGNYYSYGY